MNLLYTFWIDKFEKYQYQCNVDSNNENIKMYSYFINNNSETKLLD